MLFILINLKALAIFTNFKQMACLPDISESRFDAFTRSSPFSVPSNSTVFVSLIGWSSDAFVSPFFVHLLGFNFTYDFNFILFPISTIISHQTLLVQLSPASAPPPPVKRDLIRLSRFK
jgi:hypothetical protein